MACSDFLLHAILFNSHADALHIFQQQVHAVVAEQDFHTLGDQILFDFSIQDLRLLGAQVPDGAIHQFQSRANGPQANLLDFLVLIQPLHVGIRTEV